MSGCQNDSYPKLTNFPEKPAILSPQILENHFAITEKESRDVSSDTHELLSESEHEKRP